MTKLRKAENGNGVLRNQLTSTEKHYTTVKLRGRTKKLEELMPPPEMPYNKWQDVPRVKK